MLIHMIICIYRCTVCMLYPLYIHYLQIIWVNYNISLTWIVGQFGDDFPNPNHYSRVRSQWGRDEIYPDIWWQTPWPLLIITVNLPHQAMESQSTAPPRSRSPPSLDNEATLNACRRGKNVSSKKACQRHQTLDCFLMFFVLDHLTYQCWWSNSHFFDQIQTSNAVSNAGITVTETEGWHWTYHHLVAVLHFWT